MAEGQEFEPRVGWAAVNADFSVKLVPVNETFKTLAEQATAAKKDDLSRAKALYDHVLARMRYDKSGTGWGRSHAVYACDVRTGNCTDCHAYFIALARSIGTVCVWMLRPFAIETAVSVG